MSAEMNDTELIYHAYHTMYRGMISKDRVALESALAPEFVLVHMTGMRQNRETYISSIENGTLNYYSEETVNIYADISGSTASAVGQSIVSAAVFGGGRHTWHLEQRLKLIKRRGRWYIIKSEAGVF